MRAAATSESVWGHDRQVVCSCVCGPETTANSSPLTGNIKCASAVSIDLQIIQGYCGIQRGRMRKPEQYDYTVES